MGIETNLKEMRKMKNLRQRDLADKLNCTRVLICKYETGKTKPSFEKLVKLSEVLECSVNELVNGSGWYY